MGSSAEHLFRIFDYAFAGNKPTSETPVIVVDPWQVKLKSMSVAVEIKRFFSQIDSGNPTLPKEIVSKKDTEDELEYPPKVL